MPRPEESCGHLPVLRKWLKKQDKITNYAIEHYKVIINIEGPLFKHTIMESQNFQKDLKAYIESGKKIDTVNLTIYVTKIEVNFYSFGFSFERY
ncbi:hypothetical protein [Paenibacillus sp. MER 99-2]|uniref:hypothetical protein n=1 Tax=Paenibacillus sp. MER 99-2 TaxID=2939572 RepID=UPI00203C3CE9|nr:hypothetical protein [Paenibacillus sp. MER 99-2]MCM3173234.1 hypothetical protein [Paenibacillus sp. MER 99-2]